MDIKLRLIHASCGLILGSLLTTSLAQASSTNMTTGLNITPLEIPNGLNMGSGLYSSRQEKTSLANFSYSPTKSEIPNNAPTPVPAPAAAWLFGSGLLGLLGIGRKRKKR